MTIGAPKELSTLRRFFLEPRLPKHRQYEALRAYLVEGRLAKDVARAFGYSLNSFHVLCHHFRRETHPTFFLSPRHGPQTQPKKSAARDLIIQLRKQNHSVYEISQILKDRQCPLSPTGVREVLKTEGFAPLPRRLDEERPQQPRPTVEPVANVRLFSVAPRTFTTRCGGLFLFVADLVRLQTQKLTQAAGLPGSKMIPADHALRCCLALKLWSIERKSHVMALIADEGLALFAGLNAFPKKSYLSEYSCRIDHRKTARFLTAWHHCIQGSRLLPGESFNLDFHSVPFYGEDPLIERHYVSARSRSQPSVLVFLAQDAGSHVFCYSNADLRKGEEAEEIFQFITFWKRAHGKLPSHLVFDSKLTTHEGLARLDAMNIPFITLRRRSPKLLKEIVLLPRSAWRTVELDVPTRKYRTPRVYEQTISLAGRSLRQLLVQDLGHEEPTILLTNNFKIGCPALVTRYAQRMLIENGISAAVQFFHLDALSSMVGLKVDFDLQITLMASALYSRLADKVGGLYRHAQAKKLFNNLLDVSATVGIESDRVLVTLDKRAHNPILAKSRLADEPTPMPWFGHKPLHIQFA